MCSEIDLLIISLYFSGFVKFESMAKWEYISYIFLCKTLCATFPIFMPFLMFQIKGAFYSLKHMKKMFVYFL